MDQKYYLQDVLRCQMCDTPEPSLHCHICNINLCITCEGEHIYFSDESTEHKVVPFKLRRCITKCHTHSSEIRELICDQCNISVCWQCISTAEHKTHTLVGVVEKLESQKHILQKDLKELENSIRPEYQKCVSIINDQKAYLKEKSEKLTTAFDNHRDNLYKEIDNAIKELKSDFDQINAANLAILNEQEYDIKRSISEIAQNIDYLNELLNSNDVSRVSAYVSKNAEFRKLPHCHEVTLPTFIPQMINKEQIYQQGGNHSVIPPNTEEHCYTIDSPAAGAGLSSSDRPLIDEPRIITHIQTKYAGLSYVSCLSDEEIWTCSVDAPIMRLHNLQEELLRFIETKSGNNPVDIAVTRSGELAYTDYNNRTVNIVKDTRIRTVITLSGWRPLNVCSTSSGDLLVVMAKDGDNQTKVVRYYGFKEKQSIQYDEKGQHFYSCGGFSYAKYINENRNRDICVADNTARAVVVVNLAGKFRFSYTGPPSTTKGRFCPYDITTDSQSRILTTDIYNNCIHIIDQDGQFLRYIDNCQLSLPCGLCVDTTDNLFVAEKITGRVKLVKYCM